MLLAALPDFYRQFAESNRWGLLGPEILVALLSLATLAHGMFLREAKWERHASAFVKAGLFTAAGLMVANILRGESTAAISFGGLLSQQGRFTDCTRLFFLLAALGVLCLADRRILARGLPLREYQHLVLVVTAALMLLAQAGHFVLFFIALETAAVGLYALVGYDRDDARSLEAGVKYLVAGGLASALLLAGITLLSGAAGNAALNPDAAGADGLRFNDLMIFLSRPGVAETPIVIGGVALTLAGIAFKIGAFPFNLWIPDVYQGAPSPTTALLAVASKGAGVISLLLLTAMPGAPFLGMSATLLKILVPVTALTLIFGNLSALGQTNVKRLMGLSGISHAGFLLLGVCAAIAAPEQNLFCVVAILAYLGAYLLATMLTFGVIGAMGGEDEPGRHFTDYRRLYARNPALALFLSAGLGSLGGVPPSLGFFAKLALLMAAYKAGLYSIFVVALLAVAAGVYYYFNWLREVYHRADANEDRPDEPVAVSLKSRVTMSVTAALLTFGFLAFPAL